MFSHDQLKVEVSLTFKDGMDLEAIGRKIPDSVYHFGNAQLLVDFLYKNGVRPKGTLNIEELWGGYNRKKLDLSKQEGSMPNVKWQDVIALKPKSVKRAKKSVFSDCPVGTPPTMFQEDYAKHRRFWENMVRRASAHPETGITLVYKDTPEAKKLLAARAKRDAKNGGK